MSNTIENSESNPEEVIKSLITAMSKNNAEQIRSLFHENASQTYGSGEAKYGEAFFSWLESDIIERQGHVENAHYTTNNKEVVVTGKYSSKGYTNKANFLFTVEGGKIKSWTMRY
ncbi:nuclear transport factor 2 family protein [uncultured Marixanthomonas sp.]|uniref:nuclear transport factor 2 family protein n=1 Tax=uncultured Marixanthomonas sp. TaxID=757245 RepID=UPI0030DD8511|tara:strand:+ start:167623 stop:167967 length:345 start_codon:yes stop_codon:yes gene_type:complete